MNAIIELFDCNENNAMHRNNLTVSVCCMYK
jgi:hypothetical protein